MKQKLLKKIDDTLNTIKEVGNLDFYIESTSISLQEVHKIVLRERVLLFAILIIFEILRNHLIEKIDISGLEIDSTMLGVTPLVYSITYLRTVSSFIYRSQLRMVFYKCMKKRYPVLFKNNLHYYTMPYSFGHVPKVLSLSNNQNKKGVKRIRKFFILLEKAAQVGILIYISIVLLIELSLQEKTLYEITIQDSITIISIVISFFVILYAWKISLDYTSGFYGRPYENDAQQE